MNAQYTVGVALALTSVFSAGPLLAQPSGQPPSKRPPLTAPRIVPPPAPMVLPVLPELPDMALPPIDVTGLTEMAHSLVGLADHSLLTFEPMHLSFSFFDENARSSQDREKMREEAERQRERERELRVYDEAYRHVLESRWDRAIERFDDVISAKGSKVDAALYWKAYAQDRAGQRAESLTTINRLANEFPNSRYLQQAKALGAEVRRNAGQPANPQDQADEELKLMAIAALQHQAPEQAIPMLEKIINGTASPKLKERALFVLAQSDSPQAREILKNAAKGGSTPELQSRAITYLGTHGGRESRAVLAEVYSATNDVDVKKRILRAFMVGGEKDRLFTAAQSEQNPELRRTAVQQLGVMGAHTELQQLYGKETSVDIKKQIIQAMFVGGNSSRMIELARTEQNPELRRTAIRNLGLMGGKANGDALVEIYSSSADATVKKSVVQALAVNDNATALVAIARKEKDPVLHKEIVSRLSTMSGSKVALDYLLEILNK